MREICDLMTRDSFLELEDEQSERYKVMDAYSYLMDMINSIAIYEETVRRRNQAESFIINPSASSG